MSDTGRRVRPSPRSVGWLSAALVAAHFGFGIATEATGSEVTETLALAAAGLAVLGALLGMALVASS